MNLDFLFKTTGQKVIDAFKLNKMGKRSIVIQKVINSSKNIYILTYDSRYPYRIITYNDLLKIKGSGIFRLKLNLDKYTPKKLKLSMPLYLHDYNRKFPSDSYIVIRDLMGRERLRDESLFEEKYYKINENNKIEEIKL